MNILPLEYKRVESKSMGLWSYIKSIEGRVSSDGWQEERLKKVISNQ
jgi:hypothetical protein